MSDTNKTNEEIEKEALEELYKRKNTSKEELAALDGRTRGLITFYYIEGYKKAVKNLNN